MNEPQEIIVADDHKFVRELLSDVVQRKWQSATVHEAEDFDALLEIVHKCSADLLIIDFAMPGGHIFEALSDLKSKCSTIKIVLFSGMMSAQDVAATLEAGAAAYVPKSMGIASLGRIIDLVVQGETYVPADVVSELAKEISADSNGSENTIHGEYGLTDREMVLLNELAKGKSNKVMASALELSESAIKQAVRNLVQKLHAKNRTEAVALAVRLGIVGEDIEDD